MTAKSTPPLIDAFGEMEINHERYVFAAGNCFKAY